jgi:hypothetical protein
MFFMEKNKLCKDQSYLAFLVEKNFLFVFTFRFQFLVIYLGLACDSWASWRLCWTSRALCWLGAAEAGLAHLLSCMNIQVFIYLLPNTLLSSVNVRRHE